MIEMLGVLSIIALLSIGGIIGFRYTMTSYRAGQIQDIIAQSKILVATKKVVSETALTRFFNKTYLKSNQINVHLNQTQTDHGQTRRIYTITLNNVSDQLQQAIYTRKPNFAKMDIMVAPATDAIDEVAQDESWIEAGMSETAYEKLSEYGTLQENEKIMFSYITLSHGRRTNTDENEEDIHTPSELCPDADKHWDTLTQSCVACEGIKSEWSDVLKTCICPTGTYGEFCDPCHTPREWRDNSCQCPNTYPLWDEISGNCLECPDSMPIWNTSTKKCESCPTETPYWDAETKQCERCPSGLLWDTETNQCVECMSNSDCPLAEKGLCNLETKQCEICAGGCFNIRYGWRVEYPESESSSEFGYRSYAYADYLITESGIKEELPTEGTYQVYAFGLRGEGLVWYHSDPIPINEEIELGVSGAHRFVFIYNTPEQNNGAKFDTQIGEPMRVITLPVYNSNTHGIYVKQFD